jgi:hypothetical protein
VYACVFITIGCCTHHNFPDSVGLALFWLIYNLTMTLLFCKFLFEVSVFHVVFWLPFDCGCYTSHLNAPGGMICEQSEESGERGVRKENVGEKWEGKWHTVSKMFSTKPFQLSLPPITKFYFHCISDVFIPLCVIMLQVICHSRLNSLF